MSALLQPPRCKKLVLDAGPLLSLSPLRGLAETYFTVPQVLAELKDKRAQEHFERLGLQAGVRIEVRSPDPASLAHAIQFAKTTGDYAVLSHADLCLVALTYALHKQAEDEIERALEDTPARDGSSSSKIPTIEHVSESLKATSLVDEPENALDGIAPAVDAQDRGSDFKEDLPRNDDDKQSLDVALEQQIDAENPSPLVDDFGSDSEPESKSSHGVQAPLYDDPSESDDGEGEWITPSNIALHKSRALQLLPNDGIKSKKADEVIHVGCMTADFAMQNVLLHMGLNLMSVDGKRIQKLKTWVLRCHACFKICKDSSKKFCPSCGNPTLLRTSVTITAPGVSGQSPVMQVHLKKNFQYRTRGTIYSIHDPKPGSAKTGPGEGLILREDQLEYVRAKKRVDAKKEREEQKMMKGIFAKGEHGVGVGSWMDPDWVPEMISVGSGGKGRKIKGATDGDMPIIGHGRKNPNERRRRT